MLIAGDSIYTFRSILLYLGLFFISFLLFSTSDELRKQNSKINRSAVFPGIFSGIAIIAISLFAAFRADTVGVDTLVYPNQFLSCARSYPSFCEFLNDPVMTPGSEPLNAILVWICSRLSYNKWPLLFFYQLFSILPVYLALQQFRDRLSPALGMTVYLFVFFNNSLNMMRQSIACSFVLLSFAYLITERRFSVRFVISGIIAILFHKSGLYGIFLLLAVSFVANADKSLKKYLVYALIIASPVLLNAAISFLISKGLASQRISDYADIFLYKTYNKDWFINPFGMFSLSYLLVYGVVLLFPKIVSIIGINKKSCTAIDGGAQSISRLSSYLWNINCSGFLLYVVLLFSFETVYGIRFSIYFDYFFVLALPLACGMGQDRAKVFTLCCTLVFFWFIWIQVLGWSGSQTYYFNFETMPVGIVN